MTIQTFLVSLFSAMLINNVILSRFYGICPFLGVSKKIDSAIGMGAAVFFVMLLATLLTYPLYHYVLSPLNIPFMDTISFILVIASIVQLVEMIIKKYSASLYKSLGVFLPLITTNCAVLGVAQGNINSGYGFLESLSNTIGTSLGFAIILFVFSCIRTRLESSNVPKAFKGAPIALITAGLMTLAFMGLSGLLG